MGLAQEELIKQLQLEIETELKENKKRIFIKICKIVFVIIAILLFIYYGHIKYFMKHIFSKPSNYTIEKITTYNPPTLTVIDTTLTRIARSNDPFSEYSSQTDKLASMFDFESKELINFRDKHNNVKYKLLPMGTYSISGRTVAVNNLYTFNMDAFDKIALVDMGIVWGKCSGDADFLDRNYVFKSQKYVNGRILTTRFKERKTKERRCHIENHELQHLHIIPASNNILGILLKQKPFEKIKIDGLLVDVFTEKQHIKGSLNIYDTNETSRSGGACKVILVTSVQVDDKIYK